MVNPVYDHVVAIVIIGAIFVSSIVALPTISFANFQAIDQQQLRNTALNVMNTILLDTGTPINWGSMNPFHVNDPRVERFGLARGEESTFYELDSDKVQRLVLTNPLNYCEYNRVRELLNLEEYGFQLRIVPPFNVTNVDGTPIQTKSPITINGTTTSFAVKVSYLEGTPIPNALVVGTLVYSAENFTITQCSPIQTDALGVCHFSMTLNFEPRQVIAILRVTVADIATLIVTLESQERNDIANINFVGDEIILTMPDELAHEQAPQDARWIDNIIPITSEGEYDFLYNGSRGNDDKLTYGGFTVWNQTFNGLRRRNPVIFIFSFWAVDKYGGRKEVLVAGPLQNVMGYTVFEYGGVPRRSGAVVRLQRSVIISGMTHTVELLFWRE